MRVTGWYSVAGGHYIQALSLFPLSQSLAAVGKMWERHHVFRSARFNTCCSTGQMLRTKFRVTINRDARLTDFSPSGPDDNDKHCKRCDVDVTIDGQKPIQIGHSTLAEALVSQLAHLGTRAERGPAQYHNILKLLPFKNEKAVLPVLGGQDKYAQ